MRDTNGGVENPMDMEFPCIKVTQPIGTFFVAAIDSKLLCEITCADVERSKGEREVETYLGIERPLLRAHTIEIEEYLTTTDACFPSAIVIVVDGACFEYLETKKSIRLKIYEDKNNPQNSKSRFEIAKVIDGQHRIEALRKYKGDTFQVNVSIFVSMPLPSQAQVFTALNLARTKERSRLIYDLF